VTDCKLVAILAIARLLSRGSYPKLDVQPDGDTPNLSAVEKCSDCGEQRIKNTTK
jgi:hypothetical protein